MNKKRSNRRRKLPRRLYAILLACILTGTTLSVVVLPNRQVYAVPTSVEYGGVTWEKVEITSWSNLKNYLEDADHNYHIKLADSIDYTPDSIYDVTIEVHGTKYLDLNGYDITVEQIKDDDGLKTNNMFDIGSGATFFLDDTQEHGTVSMHAWIYSARKLDEEDILRRDIVHVEDGGTFNLINGYLCAGRSKEQWVTNAMPLDYYGIMKSSQTYTGYARNQTNGSAVVVNGGTFNMYGGKVQGRGFSYVTQDDVGWHLYAIENNGGEINIYNGKVVGLGCASSVGSADNVHIYGGQFETHTIDWLVSPWNEDKCTADTHTYIYWFTYKDYLVRETKDAYGSSPNASSFAPNSVVYLSKEKGEESSDLANKYTKYTLEDFGAMNYKQTQGYTIIVKPENYLSLTSAGENPIYMADGDNQLTGRVNINMETLPENLTFAFDGLDRYYPDTPEISGLTGFDNKYEVTWTLCDKAGYELATVTTNSNQLNLQNVSASAIKECIANGSTYILKASINERFGTEKSGISTGGYAGAITIVATSVGAPKLKTDASVVSYPYKGGYDKWRNDTGIYETNCVGGLDAKAENSTGVVWIETDETGTEIKEIIRPESTELSDRYEATFSESGYSELRIKKVEETSYYYARFYNLDTGYVETRVVAMTHRPHLDGDWVTGKGSIPNYVRGIEKNHARIYIPLTTDDGTGPEILSDEWYFSSDGTDDNKQVITFDSDGWGSYGSYESSSKKVFKTAINTIEINHLTTEDSGYYYREIIYKYPNGTEETLYYYVQLYVSSVDTADITGLTITGFDDMYAGDPAPDKDAVAIAGEDRCTIDAVEWSNCEFTDGATVERLTADSTATLTITAKDGYQFPTTLSELGKVTADGYPYSIKVGTEEGGDTISTPTQKIYVTISWKPTTDDPNWTGGLKEPKDTAVWFSEYAKGLSFYPGEVVDQQLKAAVKCPEGHQGHATRHTDITSYVYQEDTVNGYVMTPGLTLDADGRLHGTISDSAKGKKYCAKIEVTIAGSGDVYTLPLWMNIASEAPPAESAIASAPAAFHVHTYGSWTADLGGQTHSRICTDSDCSDARDGYREVEPHDYTEFEVITRATETVPGTYKTTCSVCGYSSTQTYTLEGGDALEVGIQEKAITVNDGDKVTYNAYANVEENKIPLKWKWETSTDGGKTWVQKSSTTNQRNTSSLNITATASQNNMRIRCSAESIYGNASSDLSVLNVQKIPVTGVRLNKGSASMNVGNTVSLSATVQPSNASNKALTWTSSNTAVATVSGSGVVTGKSAGNATITCTAADGSGKKATCIVTVVNPVVKVSGVSLNTTSTSINIGESETLTATVMPSNATNQNLTWSSSNSGIASVSSTGVITAKAEGTTVITCTAADGSGASAACTVKVTDYTPTEAFSARLYEKCLGRKPEDEGLNNWNNALVSKEATGAEAAYGFVFSQEYKNKNTSNEDFVEMLYEVFMNRPSDAGGKAAWVSALEQGASREKVFSGFASSAEFTNVCNAYGIERGNIELSQPRDVNMGVTGFCARMYTQALGRSFDDDGLNAWCSVILDGSGTPEEVAENFINSQEFLNKNLSNEEYVKVLYRTFMGREYDQGGLDAWVSVLNSGTSRLDVLHGFSRSPEFRNIQASFGL